MKDELYVPRVLSALERCQNTYSFKIPITGIEHQPGIKTVTPEPKTTYYSAGKWATQFTNLNSCILILCRNI